LISINLVGIMVIDINLIINANYPIKLQMFSKYNVNFFKILLNLLIKIVNHLMQFIFIFLYNKELVIYYF